MSESDSEDDDDSSSSRRHGKRRKHRKKKKSSRRYDSDDSSSYERRKKKKKRREKFSSSSSDSSESRHAKKKKHKKDKKKKKRKKKRSEKEKEDNVPTFGKYGIVRASDYHQKQRSFTVWMEEVKGILSFSGPKWELQEYFKEYMEDYNTATLPHIKYYDYDKWEMEEYQKQKAKQSTGASNTQADEALHLQDLQERAHQKRKQDFDLVRSMMSKEKVEEMKRKKQLQSEMAHAYKTGDQETYLKLKSRLEPEP